jgi:hypothetical protein
MVDHLGIGMTMLDVVHDVPDLGGSTVILAWWIIDISRHHQPAALLGRRQLWQPSLCLMKRLAHGSSLQNKGVPRITAGTTEYRVQTLTAPTKPHCSFIPSPSTKH